jgi:hypothetical protein
VGESGSGALDNGRDVKRRTGLLEYILNNTHLGPTPPARPLPRFGRSAAAPPKLANRTQLCAKGGFNDFENNLTRIVCHEARIESAPGRSNKNLYHLLFFQKMHSTGRVDPPKNGQTLVTGLKPCASRERAFSPIPRQKS